MNNFKNLNRVLFALLVMASFTFAFTSCSDDEDDNDAATKAATTKLLEQYKTPKYVFFFIGDGMSNPQINLTEAALYNKNFTLKSSNVGIGSLNIQDFPVMGMQTTHAEDRYVTGSAASATALATGYKTTIGTIAENGDHTADLKTMAEMAKESINMT